MTVARFSPRAGNRGVSSYLEEYRRPAASVAGRSLAVRACRAYPSPFSSPDREALPMPKVRLSYDGWLALPAAMREKLGLSTGYQLELELVGGAIVLRPTGAAGLAPAEPPAMRPPVEAPVPEPPPAATAPGPVPAPKRGPGRPRKVPVAVALPPNLRARGGRRKAASGKGEG